MEEITFRPCLKALLFRSDMPITSIGIFTSSTVLPKFVNYHNFWNFKIPEKYEVVLTLYGVGGSYDADSGKVLISVGKDEKEGDYSSFGIIAHEMVHIGIEHFVQKYELTHEEKERIVDLFCSEELGIEEYKIQDRGNTDIDEFVTSNDFNLPSALEDYVEEYPR